MDIFKERETAREELAAAVKTLRETGAGEEEVTALTGRLEELDAKCAEADRASAAIAALGKKTTSTAGDKAAATIGEHFMKTAGVDLKCRMKTHASSVTAPEFKAATDVHTTLTAPERLTSTQIDTNFVRPYEYPLTIADWLGSGTMTARTLVYFVEKIGGTAVEGAFTTVAENTKKPQLHFGGFEEVTETLRKIAGYIKVSTEMIDDEAFMVTELNNRLLIELKRFEEKQLLTGDGAGQNVKGILNRDHVQTGEYTDFTDLADVIFRACTDIRTATGLEPDGILMHPKDYQELRLQKDQNGQYYAGGPFQGAYGNGGIMQNPPLWGKKTIVTPAITEGTILVGAGQQAATVYRKGGVTVSTAFQNEDDFVNNRATILAEERLALAVRVPAAFCKLTKKAG